MNLKSIFSTAALGVLTIATAVFVTWWSAPSQVLAIKGSPVPVHPPNQNADALVFLTVDYCKKTDTPGRVVRQLVSDRQRILLPIQTDTGKKGCQTVEEPILIPKDTEPGIYHLVIDATYHINPVRTVVEEFSSQNFEIK